MAKNSWSDLGRKVVELLKHLIAVFFESLFLFLWAAMQYGMNRLMHVVELSGIDAVVKVSLQVIFAITTILPILVSIYREIRIMIKRAGAEIKEAKR